MNRAIYRLVRFNNIARAWLSQQLTPSGFALLCGLFVFGLIGLDIKRSISYQGFVFLLVILFVSIVLSRFKRNRLSTARKLPRFGTVGSALQYRIVINNKGCRPQHGLALTESFSNTFPSFRTFQRMVRNGKNAKKDRNEWFRLLARRRWAIAPTILLPSLAAKGETEVTAEIIPIRRGLLRFQKLTLACPDPLGLVNRCFTFSQPQSVLILPQRYELPTIQLPGSRRHQADGLALATSIGDSEEFRALREYRPGDSPRKIHWKSWAKLGKPVIKEEQEEYSVRHALILDTFQAEDYSEVMEEAVAIAASLACTVQTQESLLDLVFVSDQAHSFTIGRGLGQTEQLLELLASAQPCQDKGFEKMLPLVRSRLSLLSGCICIFLTWDEDRKALIEQLQSASVPVLVLIIATEQGLSEPPDHSCLQDSQSSLHVLTLGNIQSGLLAL
ncbi:MAG: DUF58 domain-containing protein [Cyanobacteria bacterium J06560_6]